jgi:predicted SprT family Zn-dependent metalloprotease
MSVGFHQDKSKLNQLGLQLLPELLPFFTQTAEGSLEASKVRLQFTPKLKRSLGISFIFDHLIQLNIEYFKEFPQRLAHTLFHELTHLWLYDCNHDPGHTERFFIKMADFNGTGYPFDHEMTTLSRSVKEAPFIYRCSRCSRRWYLHQVSSYSIYCGQCYDHLNIQYQLVLDPVPSTPHPVSPMSHSAA